MSVLHNKTADTAGDKKKLENNRFGNHVNAIFYSRNN
jgi:hypothetical protein